MTVDCMFSTVRPARIYRHVSIFLSMVYFHFRHNQLSLYVSLVCFDSISTKDFSARASGVCAQKKRTADQCANETFNRQGLYANDVLLRHVVQYIETVAPEL